MTHSYCEAVIATATSPWHIRLLTEKGRMLGGGADTLGLCGRIVAWDLNVLVSDFHNESACRKCVKVFKAERR